MDLNWNGLVDQVRQQLLGILGHEMFNHTRTLVPPDRYIQAIPQEILLGNLSRVDALRPQDAGFRVIADRIQASSDGDNPNAVAHVSLFLDMACLRLLATNRGML